MASAIRTASWASAMAVFMRTPSAPSSMAIGGVAGGAHARIDDHGDFGDAFAEDAEVGGVLDAEAGADGGGQGHDGGGAGVDEFAGSDEIVVGVGEDDEAFLDQDARGFDELLGVGEEGLLVADDLELHPVGEADFAGRGARCEWLRRRCSSPRCSAG